jgi:predicted metal-dependent phosphoesterase TrpH
MPRRQPFTALCRAVATRSAAGRADLHVHTTHSDGSYTPVQVVELARRMGLSAVAITDHDTVSGVTAAQAAASRNLEIVPAVEISAEVQGREFHALGYFIRTDNAALLAALQRLAEHRTERFGDMVERLKGCGVSLDEEVLRPLRGTQVLGRRHLAQMLVDQGHAGSVQEAFVRYLSDGGRVALPKVRLSAAEAIGLIRGAGGVASWAHPSYDCTEDNLVKLREWGLGAVEAAYPGRQHGRQRRLRALAASLGLAISAGSDCHGPEPVCRGLGSRTVTAEELEILRQKAQCPSSAAH